MGFVELYISGGPNCLFQPHACTPAGFRAFVQVTASGFVSMQGAVYFPQLRLVVFVALQVF